MAKKALITGMTGQDASYLAEILLEDGVEVHGLVRRSASPNYSRIEHLLDDINIIGGDMTDSKSLMSAVYRSEPDYIFNLAANSFVPSSWESPESVLDINTVGLCRLLNSVLAYRKETGKNIRVYQASSSEMFGKVRETPQCETTPFYPRSPYGVSKVASHHLAVNYRESYNMHISSGILFNHESNRRGNEFVTKKIANEAARIKHELTWGDTAKPMLIGNVNSKRDWGHAKDYMRAAYLMVQQDIPDDYVIATGETHSVKEFISLAFKKLGMRVMWHADVKSADIMLNNDSDIWLDKMIQTSPEFYRPAEVDLLLGDPSKAKEKLGWEPEYDFEGLVNEMAETSYLQEQFKKAGKIAKL